MDIASRTPDLRRQALRIALAILSVVALIGLTQCKQAPDTLTGVDTANSLKSRPGDCISDCSHKANDDMKIESDLHVDNIQKCGGDKACIKAEQVRHKAAVDRIQDARKLCMDGCHQQGGGGGH